MFGRIHTQIIMKKKRKKKLNKSENILTALFGGLAEFFRGIKKGFIAFLYGGKKTSKKPSAAGAEPQKKKKRKRYLIAGGKSARKKFFDFALPAAALLSLAAFFITAFLSRNITVFLTTDGETAEYIVKPSSVREFLLGAGIEVAEDDDLSALPEDRLFDGMEIGLRRAFPVVIMTKDKSTVLTMNSGTVGQALRRANIEYTVNDELSHHIYEDVVPGMVVSYADMEISYTTSNERITYREITQKDSTIYKGTQKVVQEGEEGESQVTRRIVKKDGETVSQEVVDKIVLRPSIDEIIKIGTKIRYQTNYKGEWREYKDKPVAGKNGWKAFTVYRITAYCTGTRTATGTKPNLGTIAVDPTYIPYGTQIWVPGYGYGVARDTGGFRHNEAPRDNCLDLWFNTLGEAKRWGAKFSITVLVKMG